MKFFNRRNKGNGYVPIERLTVAQVINQEAAKYLSQKSVGVGVEESSRERYGQIIDGLKTGSLDMSNPRLNKMIIECFGGEDKVQDKAGGLETLHEIAVMSTGFDAQLSAKVDQAKKMAAELVDYAGSSSTEKKKLLKEKVARGDLDVLTQGETEEVSRRHEDGIRSMEEEYKEVRGEVEVSRQGMRKTISRLREHIGGGVNGARDHSASSLNSVLDKIDLSLQTRFDKSIDYNVQIQMADVTSNTLDLFCYPQYNISARVAAAAAVDGKDMKHDLACLAFEDATSVLTHEVKELLSGKAPISSEMLEQRFGSFDLNEPAMKNRYEEAQRGKAATVTTAADLQTLYGNILVVDSEMGALAQNLDSSGIAMVNYDDGTIDIKQDYLTALAAAKESMQEKAREMGVVLEEKRTPTLSDEIESLANGRAPSSGTLGTDERGSYSGERGGIRESESDFEGLEDCEERLGASYESDLGDDDGRGSLGASRDSEYSGSVSEYRNSSDLGSVDFSGVDVRGMRCESKESSAAVPPTAGAIEPTKGQGRF
jgi:hypothetical protein